MSGGAAANLSDFSLAGRTALVTGAGQGIGRALAAGLGNAGARVIVTDIDGAAAARVAEEVGKLGARAVPRALDVARPDDIEAAVAWSEREVGPVDVLVNNAGVRDASIGSFTTTVEDWDRVFAINVRGPFLLCQAAARRMAERGGGSIVSIASQLGLVGMAGRPKGALINLTKTLALEWAKQGIRVNAVAPGPIRTPHTEPTRRDPATNARYQDATPLGPWPEPEEVVGAVVYLAWPPSGNTLH